MAAPPTLALAQNLVDDLVLRGVEITDAAALAASWATRFEAYFGGDENLPAQLVTKLTTAIAGVSADALNRIEWWTGAADGGFGDDEGEGEGGGYYRVTLADGSERFEPCLARILADVGNVEAGMAAALADFAADAAAAITAFNAAGAAAIAGLTAEIDAKLSKNGPQTFTGALDILTGPLVVRGAGAIGRVAMLPGAADRTGSLSFQGTTGTQLAFMGYGDLTNKVLAIGLTDAAYVWRFTTKLPQGPSGDTVGYLHPPLVVLTVNTEFRQERDGMNLLFNNGAGAPVTVFCLTTAGGAAPVAGTSCLITNWVSGGAVSIVPNAGAGLVNGNTGALVASLAVPNGRVAKLTCIGPDSYQATVL
ncbi:MAG: hypothetical protein C0481_02800 [Phenylobacterium sp.]|uniref:hypothetical protein n=1 Tax=Phenylobacterium sp. TaxID=1871053 RepID=UPI0025E8FBD2|nr:hypothetical protein [Phenylobacterium sp.]MBA4010773.1 hypothetical protein [Phenylobacterium sp.]